MEVEAWERGNDGNSGSGRGSKQGKVEILLNKGRDIDRVGKRKEVLYLARWRRGREGETPGK